MVQEELIVGIDFDNTIVSYDNLLFDEAVNRQLIDEDFTKNKKLIRDAVRQLPEGEIQWQKLQADIYGPLMSKAELIEGVKTFVDMCQQHDVSVFIVSHKTEFASMSPDGMNLRDAALDWMKKNKFFSQEGLGLSEEQVFFESTREEKIQRLKNLGCTHFIDDLEETFLEESFPNDVEPLLFDPLNQHQESSRYKVYTSWQACEDEIKKKILVTKN